MWVGAQISAADWVLYPIFAFVSFLYPLFLIAGAALAIPILVHLFNFRKFQPRVFPDIRFLKEIQQQTQKSSQLKHRLILASRLLLLTGLILAFAQPFFTKQGAANAGGATLYSFFIDNSFSMSMPNAQGTLLDEARMKAIEVIEAAGEEARFHILTHDFGTNEHRFLSKQEALEKLGTLRSSPYSRPADQILAKQAQLLQAEAGKRKVRLYLSDFQQTSFPLSVHDASDFETLFIQLQAQSTENVVVDTVMLDAPGMHINQAVPIQVRLKHNGQKEQNTQLTLEVNGQLKSIKSLTLQPGKEYTETMAFTPSMAGNHPIRVYVQDFPVSFDDTFYMSAPVGADRQILLLNEGTANAYLNAVFKTDPQFRVDNYRAVDVKPDLLRNYSLIVLNGTTRLSGELQTALKQQVEKGTQLLVFPPEQGQAGDLNVFMANTLGVQWAAPEQQSVSVSSFNRAHSLFQSLFNKVPDNVSYPSVKQRCALQSGSLRALQTLMSLSNGDIFLGVGKVGNGQIFVSTVAPALAWSDFPTSYWFLPLLHQMAYWQNNEVPAAIALGSRQALSLPNERQQGRLVYHAYRQGADIIPEQQAVGNRVQVYFKQGFRDAGWYGMALPGSSDTVFTGVNYNRDESDMRYWGIDDLKKNDGIKQAQWLSEVPNLADAINPGLAGMPLWKVCLILALIGLLAEILLIRFMK